MRNTHPVDQPNVVGIIAEYDPFHKGHLYQLQTARAQLSAQAIICVISCAFTQRGAPALFSTHARAEMALRCGADLVLGLPYSFGTAQANRFALGGVGILERLGVVTHLSFGVENDLLPFLQDAARLFDGDPRLALLIKQGLLSGLSFARAQGEALKALLPACPAEALSAPNFNLALCYLQALKRLQSAILPYPVARAGSYRETEISALPSSTSVRSGILRGDWKHVRAALPEEAYRVVSHAVSDGSIHEEGALDHLLLDRLVTISEEEARRMPDISEGLENRVLKAAPLSQSRDDLIDRVKTKRYPYARINRALCHMLVGLHEDDCPPLVPYARLLGFRKTALPLLSSVKQGGFPLISRPAKHENPSLALDMRSEQLWALGAGLPMAQAYREQVIIL